MGAQSSKSKSTIETDMVTEAYNSCPNVSASNTVNLSGVQFRPDLNPNCKDSKFEINQSAGVEADCVISSMQDSIASTVSQMSSEAQGGLGFQASSNSSDIKNQIEQKTQNSCGDQSVTNTADIHDTMVTACEWHFVQNATANSSCTLNSLQTMANDVSTQQDATTTGLTLGSFLFGYNSFTSIAMIMVLGGIAVAALKVYGGGGMGDGGFGIPVPGIGKISPKMIAIGLGVLILLFVILGAAAKKK